MLDTIDQDDVRERIRSDDCGKWDVLVGRDLLTLQDGSIRAPSDISADLVPTSWATAQFCQRLGIPTAYFRRCPTELQDFQFNHWIAADGSQSEKWFLRARGSQLRGVLTSRYTPLDNYELMEAVLPIAAERFQVSWFALTEESLHLRLIDPRLGREVLPDDRLTVGVHVANSEVGLRAVTIDALVYRLVCTNGLIRLVKGKSLLHRRHVSIDRTDLPATLSRAMHEATAVAAGFIEQMLWSTKQAVTDVEQTIRTIGSQWNLSRATQEQIQVRLALERPSQQETVYGLANAITNVAQSLPADDRYDLEALAGRLIEQGISHQSLRPDPPRREALDLCA